MVRITFLIVLLLTGASDALLADTDVGQELSGGQTDVVSADRVRDGLRRPELQIPALPPPPVTFRAEVIEKLETPLDVIRRELQEEARVSWKIPARQGIDLMPALLGLVNEVKRIRRLHAEADARRLVERELAEFCSTHDCTGFEQEPMTEGVLVR